jgi:hypothetical protein
LSQFTVWSLGWFLGGWSRGGRRGGLGLRGLVGRFTWGRRGGLLSSRRWVSCLFRGGLCSLLCHRCSWRRVGLHTCRLLPLDSRPVRKGFLKWCCRWRFYLF